MLAAIAIMPLLGAPGSIVLYRGVTGTSPAYWDYQDTFLDSSSPEESFGGSYTISGGKGKTILIRFGDLNRMVGPGKKVTGAVLLLTPSGGEVPAMKSIGRVLVPWGEGPRTVIARLYAPQTPGAKPTAPRLSATWKQRESGVASWQTAGAAGQNDVQPIQGASLAPVGNQYAISGLEKAVQFMLDHPAQNHGFAIEMASNTDFSSGKSPVGRPSLTLSVEDVAPPAGPDLSVVSIDQPDSEPKAGQTVTYHAHVKNVGTQPAQPFSALWIIDGHATNPTSIATTLAPGAETELTFAQKAEPSPTDHRAHTVGLRVLPAGADVTSANDELDIYADAIPVNVSIDAATAQKLATASNAAGSSSWEDWVQQQVQLWNETYAAGSHFSFAPDGALERIRVGTLTVGGTTGAIVPADADPSKASPAFIRNLSKAIGMLDGAKMSIVAGDVKVPGSESRCSPDLFPGVMGDGDTRFEGTIPGQIPMDYEPVSNPTLDQSYFEATDLFAATDVYGLNAHLNGRPANAAEHLSTGSKPAIFIVKDLAGRPLGGLNLSFYQSSGGQLTADKPPVELKTTDKGILVLPSKQGAGPFGPLDPDGGNGVFLVQAKTNGVVATGWIKAWQVAESAERGALTSSLYLNLPDAFIDTTENLATDRLISSSDSQSATQLGALIDDNDATTDALPSDTNSWVEIDLGKDRNVGEIDLTFSKDPMWKKFDVMAYATGQRPEEAFAWVKEADSDYSRLARSEPTATPGIVRVAYRAPYQRFRYIRLVNRSAGPGTLAGIRVLLAKAQ